MKRKFILGLLGVVIAAAIFITYRSYNPIAYDSLLYANIEALADYEDGGNYTSCRYGDVTSPASGGSTYLYCGTCRAQRIWPSGDGGCRLY